MKDTPIAVTQEDREAAVRLFRTSSWIVDQVMLGDLDDHIYVQTHARHRLAERERCARIAEEEPELPGAPPADLASIVTELRAAVRATKKSIATAIRQTAGGQG